MCLALFLLLENFHPSPSFSFCRFLLIIIIIKCVPEPTQYPSKCNEAMLGTELNKAAVGLTFRSSQYKCELPQAGGESHGGPGSPPASWSTVGSVSPAVRHGERTLHCPPKHWQGTQLVHTCLICCLRCVILA